MTDISAASISPDGYLVLQADTSYNLFGNLVLDGTSFKGVSGGDATTRLHGQGYTITVSIPGSAVYDASASFPTPIVVSNLTLINPTSEESWGFASPDATCYAFVGPLAGPTVVGIADISSDTYIHLYSGNQYTLSGDLAVDGSFSGFMVEGPENVILDGAGHTVTMTSGGGLMTTADGASLLVKGLTVDASGVDLSNGKGWIFGSGFTNKIAMDCHVTCGDLDRNSGGIFGGGNTGFVCATGCSVVCGNSMNSGSGGGGGICGGANNATISITDCTATITGSVTNGFSGGGGGMCGGSNNGIITITGCTATITGSVSNDNFGGGGGMCGGLNGDNRGIATITITSCTTTITGSVTNNEFGYGGYGGGGGMCGGANGASGRTATITITTCEATIEGDVTNYDRGGSGGMCGGLNGVNGGTADITITDCTATITGNVTNSNTGCGGGMCGGANGDQGNATITITGCTVSIGGSVTNNGSGGGGGMCGGLNGVNGGTADITITDCSVTITGDVTNDGDSGGGGMCGGLNGNGGSATISITECILYVSSAQNGIILGGGSIGDITLMNNQIILPSQFPTSLFPTSLFGYYYATESTFLYNQKTILSFVAAPRRARNWTQGEYPPEGTPLQDTGRRIVAFGRNNLKTHIFREVQHAGGAGYLCVWAASGVAPSSL